MCVACIRQGTTLWKHQRKRVEESLLPGLQPHIGLRDIVPDDIPILFEHQLSPEANWMAAFTADDPTDWPAFEAHWRKLLMNDAIGKQTILYDGHVAGSILKFDQFGKPSVAYGIDPEFWGRGIMSRALALFLEQTDERPLYARVVKDNIGSLRVLQKSGFTIIGEDKGYANARKAEVEEYILKLSG